MPRTRPPKAYKPYRKRNYRKRRVYTSTVPRSVQIVPDMFNTVLKYNQSYDMSSMSGTYRNFRGNSVYDPDETGTGEQPTGFDQLMLLYNYYTVSASKIKILCMNDSTTASSGNIIVSVIPLTVDTDSLLGFRQLMTNSFAKSRAIAPVSAGGNPIVLSNYITTKKMLPGFSVKDQGYAGTDASSPGEEWYWHVEVNHIDGVSSTDLWINVTLEYYVSFFDKRLLAIS